MSANPSPAASSDNLLFRLVRATRFWRTTLGVLVIVVLYLALTPSPPAIETMGWDKLHHAMAFFALAVSACFCAPASPRRLIAAALLLMAFGGAIELAQSQIPGRDAEWGDLLADGVGTAIGMAAALAVLRKASAAVR